MRPTRHLFFAVAGGTAYALLMLWMHSTGNEPLSAADVVIRGILFGIFLLLIHYAEDAWRRRRQQARGEAPARRTDVEDVRARRRT